MRMFNKKFLLCVLLLNMCLVALFSQQVISPTQGTWANYQSLVLDLPKNSEAFYSFTGENPLELGFAYDGPVLLQLENDVTLEIVVVNSEGVASSFSVNYTVNLQETPSYISSSDDTALLVIDDTKSITIPSDIQYALGTSNQLYDGQTLQIFGHMMYQRYQLLTINDGKIPYRYVLQIGDNSVDKVNETLQNDIQITDWSRITFLQEAPIVYSIDDNPLRQTNSGEIFVDRSEDRILKWQKFEGGISENFNIVVLPKKPDVIGIPSKSIINKGVTLSLSDSRFEFAYNVYNSEKTVLSSVYFIDTLQNDAFGFSDEIDIYYNGIKHGSVTIAFILDKIKPNEPVLLASDTSGYSRDSVKITFEAGDTVYYYMPKSVSSRNGFLSDKYASLTDTNFTDKTKYSVLREDTILLHNATGVAQFYEVFAYTIDNAGNTSSIVPFKTVIDPYNFYLKQDTNISSSLSLGTVDKPFTNFSQIHEIIQSEGFKNIYIDGVFTNLLSFDLMHDVAFNLTENSRLIFSTGELIQINDASVSFTGGTIEQTNPVEDGYLQNTLLKVNNATISLHNTEFVLSGGINSNCIILENSSAQIFNSGVTVNSLAYGSGLQANNSTVLSQDTRFVLVSETAIGMSLVNTKAQINNSTFTGVGSLYRGLEFINSSYSLVNNNFTFENLGTVKIADFPAIWTDSETVQNILSSNTFEGFSTLVTH